MSIHKLIAFAACLALAAAPLAEAAAETSPKAHHRYRAKKPVRCPVHRSVDGDLVDCHGWRLRSGGWDNSCFNLDYLPSQYACGSRGGRR